MSFNQGQRARQVSHVSSTSCRRSSQWSRPKSPPCCWLSTLSVGLRHFQSDAVSAEHARKLLQFLSMSDYRFTDARSRCSRMEQHHTSARLRVSTDERREQWPTPRPVGQGALCYSRACPNRQWPQDQPQDQCPTTRKASRQRDPIHLDSPPRRLRMRVGAATWQPTPSEHVDARFLAVHLNPRGDLVLHSFHSYVVKIVRGDSCSLPKSGPYLRAIGRT